MVERKRVIELVREFKLDNPGLRTEKIMGLMDGDVDPEEFESVQKWLAQCYNRPSDDELIMCAIDELLETFGVESLDLDDRLISYCNAGDTYAATICHIGDGWTDEYVVASWGDLVEEAESRTEEEAEDANW
jgi:hypothetical protein